MAGIIWSTDARHDLDLILGTILREVGHHHAEKWQRRFAKALSHLELTPEIGSPVEELPARNYLEQIVGPYRLIYRYDGTDCRILSISRAEQRLPRRLDEPMDDEE